MPEFDRAFSKTKPDIAKAAQEAIKTLLSNPSAKSLRLHPLKAHKPTVWKIDVFPNRSWQISFRLEGTTAILLMIGTHSKMDTIY